MSTTSSVNTRRRFLAGLAAGTLVLGFDPLTRSWISEAQAAPFDDLPDLDGFVATDPATLAPYAEDAGNIVHRTPLAVLFPGSVRDIEKMVRFAKRRGIKVAARGQGHTTHGQSQVSGGLVVDMASLAAIHSINGNSADVNAGITWNELVKTSVPLGFTPPVLTGYIGLSVGGTLSVGGVSGGYERGAQVDHVQELEVVTGEGELKRCSKRRNSELFHACLAGLGQCGIITRAVVDMVPAKQNARTFLVNYFDNASFFKDLRKLLKRAEFDDLYMLGAPNPAGGWVYQLNATKFFNPGSEPNADFLLRNLSVPPSAAQVTDGTYLDYVLRVDTLIDFLKSIGMWDGVLHPWFDVFLPDTTVEGYVGETLAQLTPVDVGETGFLLLFPLKRSKLKQPFLRVPQHGEFVYLFDILTAAPAPGPNPAFEAQMIARNRRLFERARQLGGTRYPIGTLNFTRADWKFQYGEKWDEFQCAKQRFDPANILTPGPGIF
jgi:cytokinin dehydrogenase